MKRFGILVIVVILAGLCRADVIYLKDGTRLEGDLKRSSNGWTITLPDRTVRTVAPDAIKSIELGRSATQPGSRGAAQASEALGSLRRSTEALSDINQIIDRYNRFITTAKDEKTLADARADLQTWQQRKQQGMVKYGAKWITPDEIKAVIAQGATLAGLARDLIRQNKLIDADKVMTEALATDPRNFGALYLRGVMSFRQDKIADARKSFEAVNAIVPAHAPTLNNLAVIFTRQNAPIAALNDYDQAMQVAGVNQYILDNVAEALAALPDEQQKGPVVVKVLRRFNELDRLLQQQRAQDGFYRWGGSWIDQKAMDELRAGEKSVRDKLDALQAQFDQTKQRIVDIDTQINANTESMQNMQYLNQQMRDQARDKSGNAVIFPLPDAYYDLQSQNRQLAVEQEGLKNRIPLLQEQAQNLQKQIATPKFTGIQQIVGVEGMPTPQDLPGQISAPNPSPSAPATRSGAGDR